MKGTTLTVTLALAALGIAVIAVRHARQVQQDNLILGKRLGSVVQARLQAGGASAEMIVADVEAAFGRASYSRLDEVEARRVAWDVILFADKEAYFLHYERPDWPISYLVSSEELLGSSVPSTAVPIVHFRRD